MAYVLDHFGVTVAAITGVLAARGKEVDLFGVLVLAFVTALGGGTVRDVLLGAHPVFWIADQFYLVNAAITALVMFYVVRYHDLPRTVLLVADAFALALFTTAGARKGVLFAAPAFIGVLMGVITGVAGGMFRDLLIGEIPLVFRRGSFLYATAAFGGAACFVLLHFCGCNSQLNAIASTLVTLMLRLAGIRWKIRLPLFRPKMSPGEADNRFVVHATKNFNR